MENGKTQTGVKKPLLRLSSKATLFTKVLTLLVGIPVSSVVMFKTGYVWWADLIGLAGISMCIAFAYFAVEAHLLDNDFLISGLFEKRRRVNLSAIQNIKKFKSRGQTYFYYQTPSEKFLIMCPIYGDGRKVLYKLYNEFQENPQRVRTSFLEKK